MNIAFLIPIIVSAVLSLSPSQDNLVLVGQFSIYVDANAYKDGLLEMSWESRIDKNVYRNDCSALFDLYQLKGEICSPEEYLYIQQMLHEYEMQRLLSDTTITNRRI